MKQTLIIVVILLSIAPIQAQTGYISPYLNTIDGDRIPKRVANLVSVLSATMSLLYAFQIYKKMQEGQDEMAKRIYVWLSSFILLFVGSMFVSWFFFQNTETIKVFQP